MKRPLVSIITPVYNGESYLRDTWQCLLSQTYRHWEWVVTDDASTDDTAAILRELAAADPRVRFERLEKNIGQAGTVRNRSMAGARGEYFAFLDADDRWEPRKLALQVRYLKTHPEVDVVCTHVSFFGDEERAALWSQMDLRANTRRVTPRQIVTQAMATSSILFRRKCYEQVGGMDEDLRLVIGEDTEYGIRLVMNFETHRIRRELTAYRVNPVGTSLSGGELNRRQERALALHRVIAEKKLLPPELLRLHRALTYYNEAKNNLFHYGMPFRGLLWTSIRSGAAPTKAWAMFALCWLPAPVLKRVLLGLARMASRRNN